MLLWFSVAVAAFLGSSLLPRRPSCYFDCRVSESLDGGVLELLDRQLSRCGPEHLTAPACPVCPPCSCTCELAEGGFAIGSFLAGVGVGSLGAAALVLARRQQAVGRVQQEIAAFAEQQEEVEREQAPLGLAGPVTPSTLRRRHGR